ncbi:sister chromatid cohesion 1 protein 1 [Lactuca sativa]|uniref:sister chromatid cohesion 1 protein 1 n=1 Tax=Lactuca sativa TaxID=4236 RepID=UPI000CD965C6|nr:sister chromatid cohesion 1 protein 1 [Lactuca sativa]
MFYSHQLLARKAPLGQIWMAATMHAKINRRKLDKLNIINICEEILNPSVPMALRLSGILMGGVVIVYERKVKLLYEDVTRFLVEINEAWKVKTVRDPTILPKGKSHAKYEDVTLPDNIPTDLGEIEQPLQFSNSETQREFHRSAYTEMKLDSINEAYISHNQGKKDIPQDHHQANIDDITMCDKFDSHQTEAGLFNLFERFDIDEDEETQVNSAFHDHTDIPNTLIPSPPPQEEPQIQNPDEIHEQHPGEVPNPQVSDEDKAQYNSPHNSPQRRKPTRRTTRRVTTTLMDHGQTIIPGPMYQFWLQNTSDIVSRRGQKRKLMRNNTHSVKIARLMDLPPVSLVCGLVGNNDIYYPLPILKLWTKSIQPLHDSPSGNNSPPHPPAPSSSSPPERNNYHDPISPPFEDNHGEVGSGSLGVSIENIRVNIMDNNEVMPPSIPMEKSTTNHVNSGVSVSAVNRGTVTPSNSGDDVRSMPSAEIAAHGSDVNSGRSNKKRLFSSTRRRSGSNLEPVVEELYGNYSDPIFKLSELSENQISSDLVVETGTGPTQTQKDPIPDQPVEQLTDSIRMQLKMHFDAPGSPQTESLNQLALGLNRKAAAGLFYQTCVMATRCFIRVEQRVAYGDILISRGAKM